MKYETVNACSAVTLKRLVGVDRWCVFIEMLLVLESAAQAQRKSGRSTKLCLADQLLLTLGYWHEYVPYLI